MLTTVTLGKLAKELENIFASGVGEDELFLQVDGNSVYDYKDTEKQEIALCSGGEVESAEEVSWQELRTQFGEDMSKYPVIDDFSGKPVVSAVLIQYPDRDNRKYINLQTADV